MRSKGDFPQALKKFCKKIGVPSSLICDPSGEQTSKEVKKWCREVSLPLRILEEHSQHSNLAERYVGIFKNTIAYDLKRTRCPLKLWDFCCLWRMKIHNLTASGRFKLEGLNPHYLTLGTKGDISNLCVFGFFSWIMYFDQGTSFPEHKWKLGICLGPSDNIGNEMLQWVIGVSMVPVPRQTV